MARRPFISAVVIIFSIIVLFGGGIALTAWLRGDELGGLKSLPGFAGNKIGVLPITGTISDVGPALATLERYRKDSSIKAILMRVNSPGGGGGGQPGALPRDRAGQPPEAGGGLHGGRGGQRGVLHLRALPSYHGQPGHGHRFFGGHNEHTQPQGSDGKAGHRAAGHKKRGTERAPAPATAP